MVSNSRPLGWVDGFVRRIRSYVEVRLVDNVLIRMPNEAFKLNPSGARVLHYLLNGGTIADVMEARRDDPELIPQLESFFNDLARLLAGAVCDNYRSPSLDRTRFDLGYIEWPILSEIAVTWLCNLKCRFCYAACSQPDEKKDMHPREMSTHQVKRILKIIRSDARVPSVSFTGGEPTLRKDLTALISHAAKKLNMRVNLITNGTRIDTVLARRYRRAGLASAQVSIESPDPRVHNAMVGQDGAFEKSLNGLNALRDAGITVHPHSTICRTNRTGYIRMAEWVAAQGLDRFSANMVIPTGRGDDDELTVTYSEIGEILEAVMSASQSAGIRFMWYSPTPVCLFNPVIHHLGNKGCSACEGLLSVDPYGNLLPCSSWRDPVGNLLDAGFESLWFGDRARWLRQKHAAHSGCRGCDHFALCHGACPLYFEKHGYQEIEPALAQISQEISA